MTSISRREALRGTLKGLAGLATISLLGCGGSSAAPAGSSKAGSQSAAAAGLPTGAEWDRLLQAARQEGKVAIAGPPDETRKALPEAFKAQTGVEAEYLDSATSVATRLQSERTAGQYTVDVLIAGSDSAYGTLLPNGWLDAIKPSLVPSVAAGSGWRSGAPLFRDPRGDTILQVTSDVIPTLSVNPAFASPAEISSAEALLDAKWKGKIASFDPGVNGPGAGVGAALYVSKGKDFVTKLYKDQKVVISRDYRQLADWLGHGTYPIVIALTYNYFADLVKNGIQIVQPELSDSPPSTAGGFGLLCMFKPAPHPNAAKLFVNWMASKAGLTVYGETHKATPLRTDIDATWMPANLVPKPGVKYLDTYDYDFATKQRLGIRDFYAKMLST